MRFLILGPLEAHDGERRLSLGGTKQRALLAMLLLHANEVVSNDRLVDALWGEAPADDAAKALSVAVSRLRNASRRQGTTEPCGPMSQMTYPGIGRMSRLQCDIRPLSSRLPGTILRPMAQRATTGLEVCLVCGHHTVAEGVQCLDLDRMSHRSRLSVRRSNSI